MPSFQVLVLGFAVGFLSPFPDSLPQLFLRCFPYALAFGLSPSNPLPFVRFSSGSGYSASASSFPSLPGSASQRLPRCALPLSLLWLSPFFPARFPVLSFPVLVLGFLFVSFRPSLIRSHSRSSGAYFQLSLSVFSASLPLSFVRFRFSISLLSLCFFFSLFFPFLPHSGFFSMTLPLSLLGFPRSLPPGFPFVPSRFRYSAFCLFPFVLP